MEFDFTPQQIEFREEVKAFLEKEMTKDVLQRALRFTDAGYVSKEITKKFIDKGWYVPHWPRELGGQGLGSMELTIFFEDVGYVRVYPGGIHYVAENIRLYGTEEQKRFFLPRFARGEIDFTLGISEPNAGVDAGNIQIRAELRGDEFVINGQKMWGGRGEPGYSKNNWHWLVCRTDPDLPRHRGLSIVMVPLESPGIAIRPVPCIGSIPHLEDVPSTTAAAISYDNVHVPRSNLLGELNRGFYQLMTGVETLRAMLGPYWLGEVRRTLDDTLHYLQERRGSGRFADGAQALRHRVVELKAEAETLRHLSYHIAALDDARARRGADDGYVPASHLAAMTKIWGGELVQRVSAFAVQAMGLYGTMCHSEAARWLPSSDEIQRLSRWCRTLSIGGGSSEVMRTQVAQRYLTLPRS